MLNLGFTVEFLSGVKQQREESHWSFWTASNTIQGCRLDVPCNSWTPHQCSGPSQTFTVAPPPFFFRQDYFPHIYSHCFQNIAKSILKYFSTFSFITVTRKLGFICLAVSPFAVALSSQGDLPPLLRNTNVEFARICICFQKKQIRFNLGSVQSRGLYRGAQNDSTVLGSKIS